MTGARSKELGKVFRHYAKAILPIPLSRLLSRWRGNLYSPPVKHVRFGDLRRRIPISRQYGFDRGLPVDRYFIEKFLMRYAEDIKGRVLEVGDDAYTRKFGAHRVTKSDILNIKEGNPKSTFLGDLAGDNSIPSAIFDCVILTQTLQLIFDVPAALATVYRIMKPGGVVLATFPGISQIAQGHWDDTWYWGFTGLSAQRLFEERFPRPNVIVEVHGNVLAAIAFLHGLSEQELDRDELDYCDPEYQTLITVRAEKPS